MSSYKLQHDLVSYRCLVYDQSFRLEILSLKLLIKVKNYDTISINTDRNVWRNFIFTTERILWSDNTMQITSSNAFWLNIITWLVLCHGGPWPWRASKSIKQACPNWVDAKDFLMSYWSKFVQRNGLSYKGFNPYKSCLVECNGGPSWLHINCTSIKNVWFMFQILHINLTIKPLWNGIP